MIDGIKLLDLSVSTDALLHHPRLLFPLALDEQTGAVLDRPRRAYDQGLRFSLVPAIKGDKLRCELQGSLHRYQNWGHHNADDFGVAQLLATLDELVTRYGIDPFSSRLNNVEFGVNVQLPFPVRRVLANLISYKYRPFTKEAGEAFAYYQCYTQRYVVKLYDKGAQYRATVPDLPPNVLRIEIKVLKMEYLSRQGIQLEWLADLLNVENYERLGQLLVTTFDEILFDEPNIKPDLLNVRQRDTYQNGRNPKFWTIPEELSGQAYNRHQKNLKRVEQRFRALLGDFRQGADWQGQTAMLISQTWDRLTVTDEVLIAAIHDRLTGWKEKNNLETTGRERPESTEYQEKNLERLCPILTSCSEQNTTKRYPLLTDFANAQAGRETESKTSQKCPILTESENGKMSDINRLSIGLKVDIVSTPAGAPYLARGTPLRGVQFGTILTRV